MQWFPTIGFVDSILKAITHRYGYFALIIKTGGDECNLFHLSNILGHSNLMTTAIYLHVNSDAKRAALGRGVPRF